MTISYCKECGQRFDNGGYSWKKVCTACYVEKKKAEHESLAAEVEELRGFADQARFEIARLRRELACQVAALRQPAIEPDMLGRLIRLCHPDRHQGSEAANIATAWLLEQRRGAA